MSEDVSCPCLLCKGKLVSRYVHQKHTNCFILGRDRDHMQELHEHCNAGTYS